MSNCDYFSLQNPKGKYCYDFGDNWEHELLLEKIIPREAGQKYPLCLDGERACPPEDCGGTWGFEKLLQIIQDKNHPLYKEKTTWLGGIFDRDFFAVKAVKFTDPEKHWKSIFEDVVHF